MHDVNNYKQKGVPEPGQGRDLFTLEDHKKLRNGPMGSAYMEALRLMSRVEGHEKCGVTFERFSMKHHDGVEQQIKENGVANKIAKQKADGTFDDWEEKVMQPAREQVEQEEYQNKRRNEPKFRKVYGK